MGIMNQKGLVGDPNKWPACAAGIPRKAYNTRIKGGECPNCGDSDNTYLTLHGRVFGCDKCGARYQVTLEQVNLSQRVEIPVLEMREAEASFTSGEPQWRKYLRTLGLPDDVLAEEFFSELFE